MAKKKTPKKGASPPPTPADAQKALRELERTEVSRFARTSGDPTDRRKADSVYTDLTTQHLYAKKRVTPAEFSTKSAQQKEELMEKAFSAIDRRKVARITSLMKSDSVYKTKKGYDPRLLAIGSEIAQQEDLLQAGAPADARAIIKRSRMYTLYEKAVRTGDTSELPEYMRLEIASDARFREAYDDAISQGDDHQQALLEASIAVYLRDEIPPEEYVKKGAEHAQRVQGASLERQLGNNYVDKIAGAIGKTLQGLANTANPQLQEVSRGYLHRAYTGRRYGQGNLDTLLAAA